MLYDLFSDFFGDDLNLFMQSPKMTVQDHTCPNCHMRLSEFARTGKLGCSECYNAFRPQLMQVLSSIHSNTTHTGKISKNASERLKRKRTKEDLEHKLQAAIETQNFEEAAKLRDQIRALEKGGN